MKGILTFTLAAGVAVTTSSISSAAGLDKGGLVGSKAPASLNAPMGQGNAGLSVDRVALTRELDRINALMNAQLNEDDSLTTHSTPVPGKIGSWTF